VGSVIPRNNGVCPHRRTWENILHKKNLAQIKLSPLAGEHLLQGFNSTEFSHPLLFIATATAAVTHVNTI
jgi:hypothetical protein